MKKLIRLSFLQKIIILASIIPLLIFPINSSQIVINTFAIIICLLLLEFPFFHKFINLRLLNGSLIVATLGFIIYSLFNYNIEIYFLTLLIIPISFPLIRIINNSNFRIILILILFIIYFVLIFYYFPNLDSFKLSTLLIALLMLLSLDLILNFKLLIYLFCFSLYLLCSSQGQLLPFMSIIISIYCSILFSVYSEKYKNKIFINGRFLEQNFTGVQNFANEISIHLLKFSSDYLIITPVSCSDEKYICLPVFSGTIWEQLTLPLFLKLINKPTLINLCNSAPILYKNQYVTIHDVAFKINEMWYSPNFTKWYNFLIPQILKKSKHTFTVSHFSKKEIIKYYNVKEQNITVLYNGVKNIFRTDSNLATVFAQNYVLSVGTFTNRKNQLNLVKAYLQITEPQFKLILAGSFEDLYGHQTDVLYEINKSKNIILVEKPTDIELSNLYKNASFSVYLSHYEGFGLPILESLQHKCPVLASDIEVFHELFDNYIHFTNHLDINVIKSQLLKMHEQTLINKQSLISKPDITSQFSYSLSAKLLDDLLKKHFL